MAEKDIPKQFISKNTKTILDRFESYIIVNDVVKCKFCGFEQKYNSRVGIKSFKQPSETDLHRKNKEIYHKLEEIILEGYINSDSMDLDILNLICNANLSFNIIDNPYFILLFRKLGVNLCSGQNYRAEKIRNASNVILNEKIKSLINKNFYLSFVETTESMGRRIFNIIVGELSHLHFSKPFLLFSGEVDSCKADALLAVINNELNKITPNNLQKSYLKLLLSDGAVYCRKIRLEIKKTYKGAKHIICLCHNLHNLCESIKENNPLVIKFVNFFKNCLRKKVLRKNS